LDILGSAQLALGEIESSIVDDGYKGIPGGIEPFPLGEIAKQKWNILNEDVTFPCAVIVEAALEANSQRMKAFTAAMNVALCPHGKTSMAPQLFQRQLDDGAWGITAATVNQVQVYRRYGVPRVLMANQLLGRQEVRWVLEEMERDDRFDFFCLVDSADGVNHLAQACRSRSAKRPIKILLEVGHPGARTGVRSVEAALQIAGAIAESDGRLLLSGIECFEGTLPGQNDDDIERRITALYDLTRNVALACDRAELFGTEYIVLSGGGSAYYDMAANALRAIPLSKSAITVLRSGCYITHDSKWLARYHERLRDRTGESFGAPQEALYVWARIQSLPEAGRAIATLGRRDVSFDMDLPVPRLWFRPGEDGRPVEIARDGFAVNRLDDQHAYVDIPNECDWRVGDLVAFGISHPCTTFDKWRLLFMVDEDYNVTSAIKTFF